MLALLLLDASNFSSFWLLVFAAAFLGIYLTLLHERASLRTSFWLLPIIGAVALSRLDDNLSVVAALLVLVFAVLLFLEVGIIQFFLKNRALLYRILHIGLLLSVFMILFSSRETMTLFGETAWFISAFVAVFLLSVEGFRFSGIAATGRIRTMSAVVGLLAVELVWLVRFLPLGFLNGAAFMALILVLLREAFEAHIGGSLTVTFIFRELVVFVLFAVVIFASSQWVI